MTGSRAGLAGVALASLLASAAPAHAEPKHDFELYDLASDRLVNLAKVRRSARLVLVDFFSELCEPCKAALPGLRRLHQRFAGQGLAVVIVAAPGASDREQALRATQRIFAGQPVPFPVVWDKYWRVAVQYGVVRKRALQLPQAFLVDPQGVLLRKAVSAASLDSEIARLLR